MRVAVVTGSNKGIGLAIVKQLCQQFDGVVYLTARNEELGQTALADLKRELTSMKCSDVRYHQLEITDDKSIQKLRDHLVKDYGGLDVLVNNAAIAFKSTSTEPFGAQVEETMKVNYFGTKKVCEILFPILKPHARVVNVSSQVGYLKQVSNEELKSKFLSSTLTVDELDNLINKFVGYAKAGTHQQHGYSNSGYGMSKVATTALTFIQQRSFDKDTRADLIVNACCPGFVATDMSSQYGIPTDQGAETPVYLALIPPNSIKPKGQFLLEKKERNWINGDILNTI